MLGFKETQLFLSTGDGLRLTLRCFTADHHYESFNTNYLQYISTYSVFLEYCSIIITGSLAQNHLLPLVFPLCQCLKA